MFQLYLGLRWGGGGGAADTFSSKVVCGYFLDPLGLVVLVLSNPAQGRLNCFGDRKRYSSGR